MSAILVTATFDDATTRAIANTICDQYETDGLPHIREWLWDYIVQEAIPDFFGGVLALMGEIAVKHGVEGVCDGWREGDVWREIDHRIQERYRAIEEHEERRVRYVGGPSTC